MLLQTTAVECDRETQHTESDLNCGRLCSQAQSTVPMCQREGSLFLAHLHRAPHSTYPQGLAGCLISIVGCLLCFPHSFNDAGVGIGGIDCPLDKAILVCVLDNAVLEDEAIKSMENTHAPAHALTDKALWAPQQRVCYSIKLWR